MKDVNSKEVKRTQGNIKLRQHIEDLKRNKYFIQRMKTIRKILANEKLKDIEKDEALSGQLTDLLQEYKILDKVAEGLLNQMNKVYEKIYDEMAEDYGIENELFRDLMVSNLLEKEPSDIGDYYDMCRVYDSYDDFFNPEIPSSPAIFDHSKKHNLKVYPVSIEVHKFATKRDILDFVEKRWDRIESFLDQYRGDKKIRFRQRKITREMTDFLWENKGLDIKDLQAQLNAKFPKNGLAYNEIYKILSLERNRRTKKIIVGQ